METVIHSETMYFSPWFFRTVFWFTVVFVSEWTSLGISSDRSISAFGFFHHSLSTLEKNFRLVVSKILKLTRLAPTNIIQFWCQNLQKLLICMSRILWIMIGWLNNSMIEVFLRVNFLRVELLSIIITVCSEQTVKLTDIRNVKDVKDVKKKKPSMMQSSQEFTLYYI